MPDLDRKKLMLAGFTQGLCCSAGECSGCGKEVRANRSWWWRTNFEYKEYDCYCKRCAVKKMQELMDP